MSGALSDERFVRTLADELGTRGTVALASLLSTRGSMPRHAGARLATLSDGRVLGTVGGGAIELMAIERAHAVLAGAAPSLEWVTSEQSEMACGGDALLAVRLLSPSDAATLNALADVLADGARVTVVERWGGVGTPGAPASPGVVAPTLSVEGPSRLSEPAWDEENATYREPVAAPTRLHIFGAGHVGSALVGLAASVGFEVSVYDDRPELCSPGLLPAAAHVRSGDFDELARTAPIGPRDFVVVLTHGHRADELVLERVLSGSEAPAYVGCIGSARKAALARAHLVEAGVDAERAESVALPIGLAIGADTPAEIALSIAAQLVLRRARLRGEGPGKGEHA